MGAFEHLGPAMQGLRRERHLLQRDVEAAAELPPRTLSNYETGKKLPAISTLERILDAMAATVEDLGREMRELESARPPEPKPREEAAGEMLHLLREVIDQTLRRQEEERERERQRAAAFPGEVRRRA